jgi:hypothetical protein
VVHHDHAHGIFVEVSSTQSRNTWHNFVEIFQGEEQFLDVGTKECHENSCCRIDAVRIGEGIDAQAQDESYKLGQASVEIDRQFNDEIDIKQGHSIAEHRHLVQDEYLCKYEQDKLSEKFQVIICHFAPPIPVPDVPSSGRF